MLVEDVKFGSGDGDATVLTGVVRGKSLKADRLVHVGDWGTFQIEKITAAPLRKRKTDDTMTVDGKAWKRCLRSPGTTGMTLRTLRQRKSQWRMAETRPTPMLRRQLLH